jgi:hypothetical protein
MRFVSDDHLEILSRNFIAFLGGNFVRYNVDRAPFLKVVLRMLEYLDVFCFKDVNPL